MVLIKLLKAMLDSKGFEYIERDGTVQMMMSAGGHKWNAAFTADKEGFLRYYGRYPMAVSADREQAVLRELNRLNCSIRAGSFMIADGYPLFRYGVYIFDEFTAAESVADLLTVASAQTAAAWEDIQRAILTDRVGK